MRATRDKLSLGGIGLTGRAGNAGGLSSSTSEARDAMLDEALQAALVDAAQELVSAAPRLVHPGGVAID